MAQALINAGKTVLRQFMEGKLEKAKIYQVLDVARMKMGNDCTVQFNPSEYQISRSLNLGKKRAVGRDQDLTKLQPASGSYATLSLNLYFDTDSDLGGFEAGSLSSAVKSVVLPKLKKEPCEVCHDISSMLKYDAESHAPLMLRFLWGKLDFIGTLCSSTLEYTMFARDGTPLRCKMHLTLMGEETALMQKIKMHTFNSPNRTKERTLTQGDPLWILAQQEYDDPAMWRVIAHANGILNPRSLGRARALKVPSIK